MRISSDRSTGGPVTSMLAMEVTVAVENDYVARDRARGGMASEEWPGAEQWVPDRPSLKRLHDAVQDCRGCELYRDATQAVMGDGRASAQVMILGEQPGDKEDLAGEPFVGGTAGKAVYGSSFRVGETRGRLIDWPDTFPVPRPPAWVLTTTHPSAVLRTDDRLAAYEELVSDLKVAVSALPR